MDLGRLELPTPRLSGVRATGRLSPLRGAQFLSPSFAGELYGPGELLDATTHYIILTDAIGHGGSSKPSDGLHARFPKYGYHDMVTAQHRLLTEHLGVKHLWLVMGTSMGGNPITHYRAHPTLESVDEAMAQSAERSIRSRDANDVMYAFAASEDYNPAPDLEKIQAPLLAINSADDLINPPELQILENEIKRVRNGRAIVIPLSDQTVGHGTHTRAAVWKNYLEELLAASDPSPKPQRLPS
jgi:homoserine acetyltransferase